jgi:hypothetical protein
MQKIPRAYDFPEPIPNAQRTIPSIDTDDAPGDSCKSMDMGPVPRLSDPQLRKTGGAMQLLRITRRNTPPSKTIERLARQTRQPEKFQERSVKCHAPSDRVFNHKPGRIDLNWIKPASRQRIILKLLREGGHRIHIKEARQVQP